MEPLVTRDLAKTRPSGNQKPTSSPIVPLIFKISRRSVASTGTMDGNANGQYDNQWQWGELSDAAFSPP
jgi:hypothetical protein